MNSLLKGVCVFAILLLLTSFSLHAQDKKWKKFSWDGFTFTYPPSWILKQGYENTKFTLFPSQDITDTSAKVFLKIVPSEGMSLEELAAARRFEITTQPGATDPRHWKHEKGVSKGRKYLDIGITVHIDDNLVNTHSRIFIVAENAYVLTFRGLTPQTNHASEMATSIFNTFKIKD